MSLFRPLLRLPRSLPITRAFSHTAPNSAAKISIVGRLGNAPELLPSENGPDIIRYGIATSYGGKNNSRTSWFRVAYFTNEQNARMKQLMLNLPKGSLVWVEGDAYMHSFEAKDGTPQTQLRVVQRSIEFLEKRRTPDAEEDEAEGEAGEEK
ncbi:ssDNA-binding protein, mitochondrial [Lobaria immixta]|nr:ssDNA-binding protein, mitochondrial [Lobaria immixta]